MAAAEKQFGLLCLENPLLGKPLSPSLLDHYSANQTT